MIRILIAEDQALVRDALSTLLQLEDDFDVVASVGDGKQAVDLVRTCQPDVALVDIEMPIMSGLEVVERLTELAPHCRCILVTTFARPGYMQRALKAGAKGYLLKDTQVDELADAIRRICQGARIFHPSLMMEAMTEANPLSQREVEILRCVANGLTTKDTAKVLMLTEGTVRNYLSEAMSKLDCSSRRDAAQLAESKGWI